MVSTGSASDRPSPEILQDWINCVNTEGVNLTPWEQSFVESITDQFERSGRLTERQIEILERIYSEKTP